MNRTIYFILFLFMLSVPSSMTVKAQQVIEDAAARHKPKPRPTKPAAKPRPAAKPKPTRRTSSAGRNKPRPTRTTETEANVAPQPIQTPAVQESVTSGLTIDLGLSVKWASHNVGANSPEGYGNYYGWADPSGKKTSKDVNDYPSANPPSNICGTSYDMARQNWGGSWRLPTKDECKELVNNCTYKVFTLNGVKGMKFTSKKNGNSIFLPFAGRRWDTSVNDQDIWGYYWSGTLGESDSDGAYNLNVLNIGGANWSYYDRTFGFSVRPVTP